MADYGQQQQQGTDAYGNPVGQTDQYGNQTHHTGGGTVGGYGTGAGTGAYGGSDGTGMHGTGAHDQSSQLHRSCSSSSSEDDGIGGRRKKKGIKEKIKEKLPGGHNKEGEQPYGGGGYGSTAAGEKQQPYGGGGYGSTAAGEEQQHGQEKKGMMEKIKEKLPGGGGGHHN